MTGPRNNPLTPSLLPSITSLIGKKKKRMMNDIDRDTTNTATFGQLHFRFVASDVMHRFIFLRKYT